MLRWWSGTRAERSVAPAALAVPLRRMRAAAARYGLAYVHKVAAAPQQATGGYARLAISLRVLLLK
jgi:hypothetical protein